MDSVRVTAVVCFLYVGVIIPFVKTGIASEFILRGRGGARETRDGWAEGWMDGWMVVRVACAVSV